jgi:hypothetical protein
MIEPPVLEALHGFLDRAYPGIEIHAEPYAEDPARTTISFRHELFAALYPQQRYHYLINLIPEAFIQAHLDGTVWLEMAPGESPHDLGYPDPELIEQITPDVMAVLERSGFVRALDLAFCPRLPLTRPARCHGDFRVSRALLPKHGFTPEEFFDVFHVLMARGGYCDCEILYNAVEESRLKTRYWQARAKGMTPHDPHTRAGP